jgi:hypothetical protein
MTGANEMTAWPARELESIGAGEEIGLASRRPDNPWYRRALAGGAGRIRAGGTERDVTFTHAAPEDQDGIDAAYHEKYDRYGPRIVGSVTGPGSHAVTVRLVPQPGGK